MVVTNRRRGIGTYGERGGGRGEGGEEELH